MFVVTNTFQPAFTGISSFFFVLDPRITLDTGLDGTATISEPMTDGRRFYRATVLP
jgi:hypothetical protein